MRRIVAAVLDGADGALASGGVVPADPAAETADDRPVRIAVGADHGGYPLKERIARWLRDAGYLVRDCGTSGIDPVDYPDFAHAVARLVADGSCRWGIVVDGAGIGSCMVANKVPGVRAACCHDISSARNSREHNHANVLTLGGRLVGEGLALEIVETWLATPWGPGRHAARVDKISAVERRYLAAGRTPEPDGTPEPGGTAEPHGIPGAASPAPTRPVGVRGA